jgi:perosamine synthetase
MFTVLLRLDSLIDRDAWIRELANRGVESRPVFYPIHTMPAYRNISGSFPIAERCAKLGINLPTHGNLSREDVTYVCEQAVASWHAVRERSVPLKRAA